CRTTDPCARNLRKAHRLGEKTYKKQNGQDRHRTRGRRTRPSVRRTRCCRRSTLRVLRRLTGLLETVLLAFLDPDVPGEEAGLLERRAVVGLVRDQRARDAQPQRTGLAGDAATAQVGDDVERLRLLGGHHRLLDELLVHLAREVGLEVTPVAGDL